MQSLLWRLMVSFFWKDGEKRQGCVSIGKRCLSASLKDSNGCPESTWRKERTSSCKLVSDLHKHTMACVYIFTQIKQIKKGWGEMFISCFPSSDVPHALPTSSVRPFDRRKELEWLPACLYFLNLMRKYLSWKTRQRGKSLSLYSHYWLHLSKSLCQIKPFKKETRVRYVWGSSLCWTSTLGWSSLQSAS